MRVLIVGCGYVGTPLGAELVRQGHTVFGLRRSSAGEGDLKAAGIVPLAGDITRREDLAKLPGPFDWVVNTVSSGQGGVEAYREVYLNGMRHLVDWLRGAPLQKFVYTSSTGVYAQNDGSTVTETSATEPAAETSRVLLAAEQVLRQAAPAFPAVILRVAGIYGPERGYPFRQYLKGEAAIVGRGDRVMNMIHRDDVAGCIIAALERGRPGEIYNAVDNEPVTQREFYEWLAGQLGRPMPPAVPESAEPERKRGVTSKRVSNRKLVEELGCRLKYPTFRDGYAALIAQARAGGP